jgi:hypothetical protein
MMGRETGVLVDHVIADGLSAANMLRDVFAALNDRALQALPPRATILGENSTQRRMAAPVAALLPRLEAADHIPGFGRRSSVPAHNALAAAIRPKGCRSSHGGDGRPAGAVRES